MTVTLPPLQFVLLLLHLGVPVDGYPSQIPIESFTNSDDHAAIATLNFTIDRLNSASPGTFLLEHRHKSLRISRENSWDLMSKICGELRSGFMLMMAGVSHQRPYEAYMAVLNGLEVPMINWDLSPRAFYRPNNTNNFEVSIRPPTAPLLADLVLMKGWKQVVYWHDAENADKAAQNLRLVYLHLQRKNESIRSEMLQLPDEVNDFGKFLQTFNLQRFDSNSSVSIITDTANSFRQQRLLQAIRSAQFIQQKYHYVVANFDLQPYDVQMFQQGNINITGFQLIDRESREYALLSRMVELKMKELGESAGLDLETRLAYVHDAVVVAKAALESTLKKNDSLFQRNFRRRGFYNRNFSGIYCHPSTDRENPNRPSGTFEHGKAITAAFSTLSLAGSVDGTLTGRIEFDRDGMRKNFLVSVLDLTSDTKSAFNKKELLFWKHSVGFLKDRTEAQHVRTGQLDSGLKKVLRVVTVRSDPFVMLKRECDPKRGGSENASECEGNSKFEGYCIDLLKLLAEREDFRDINYDIFISQKNQYGAKQQDGSWDGIIGHLLRAEADLSVASLTINQDRERVVDFSKPFLTTGISIMIKKPDKQEFSVFSFMAPLSSEIWMYIIFAYVGVSVVIFLVSRFSPYEWRVEEMASGAFTISNDFSVYNCLWFTLAAFMQQGTDILPRSISGRIASSAWWFFTMIIESVDDLAKQTKIKYGIQAGGSTAQFFEFSSVQMYQRMWRFMESQVPTVLVSSYDEGIERVRAHKGRYAFMLEATANEYANNRKPCDTMKVGANLNTVGYGIATPFGSEWKDVVNLAVLALQERGELKKLENKWWYHRGQCDKGISDGSSESLNLSKVAGIFYILIGGMIASMLAAFGEFLYRSRIEARKGQISSMKKFRESLGDQLKLSVQGSAIVKEGTVHEMMQKHKADSLLPANYAEPSAFCGGTAASPQKRDGSKQIPPPPSYCANDNNASGAAFRKSAKKRGSSAGGQSHGKRHPYNTAV
uniref:Glutamate receptor 1 n=1 Tax=Globodera rostochiensis TaxID=31243 RepID=A0A914GTZ2_GLORO